MDTVRSCIIAIGIIGIILAICIMYRCRGRPRMLYNIYAKGNLALYLHVKLVYGRMTIAHLILFGLYATGNFVPMMVGIMTRLAVGARCGRMAFANVTLLVIGGRANVYSNGLRLSLVTVQFFHQAFGFLVVLQAIVHGALPGVPATIGSSAFVSGILVRILERYTLIDLLMIKTLLVMALALVLSLPFVRRNRYEYFQYTHWALSKIFLAVLLWHLPPKQRPLILFPIIVWAIDLAYKTYRTLLHSHGAEGVVDERAEGRILAIAVTSKSNIKLNYPAYFHVRMGSIIQRLQSHPLMVVDWYNTPDGSTVFKFIMQQQTGRSRPLTTGKTSVVLDGPWATGCSIRKYRRVYLVGTGMGLIALLACLKQNLKDGNCENTTIQLYWYCQSEDDCLQQLQADLESFERAHQGGFHHQFSVLQDISGKDELVQDLRRQILGFEESSIIISCANHDTTQTLRELVASRCMESNPCVEYVEMDFMPAASKDIPSDALSLSYYFQRRSQNSPAFDDKENHGDDFKTPYHHSGHTESPSTLPPSVPISACIEKFPSSGTQSKHTLRVKVKDGGMYRLTRTYLQLIEFDRRLAENFKTTLETAKFASLKQDINEYTVIQYLNGYFKSLFDLSS